MRYQLPASLLEETFTHFRRCGGGKRECQALWVGPWAHPHLITEVVHPRHSASPVGFQLDDGWLSEFWTRLAQEETGIRFQCHTHPGAAYHSATDDAFPIITSPGFLSLVIPRFATGPVGFGQAFLAQIDEAGTWNEVAINDHLEII
jgi:hypothetical protein